MHLFTGSIRYEYHMAIRRPAVWVGCALAAWLYAITLLGAGGRMIDGSTWQMAATSAAILNLFMPAIGGIAIADRLVRDRRLGVDELLRATPLLPGAYEMAKYLGAVAAALTPLLVVLLAGTALLVAQGASPWLFGAVLVAFLAINVPTYLFVGAFSLGCPAVIPLRLYQVLFVGYWGWATLVPPEILPTVNGTLLAPAGLLAASAFFDAPGVGGPYSVAAVTGNLAFLLAGSALALAALHLHLQREWRQA